MNTSLLLFLSSMMLGVMVSLCSNNMITIWIGLEISLLSFIPVMVDGNLLNSESSMKYFIMQSFSSSLLLIGVMILIMNMINIGGLIISLSLLLKLGVAPFHMWVLSVVEGLNYLCLFIMLFIMKLVPLFIIGLMNYELMMMSLLTMIIGSVSGLIQNSIRKLLAFSSIYNLGLVILCVHDYSLWLVYFLIYGLILMLILMMIFSLNSNYINQIVMIEFDFSKKMVFWLSMLSMGGLPPFLGFLNKLIIIEFLLNNNNLILLIILIMTALLVIFYYIRLSFISMFFSSILKWNIMKNSSISFLTLLINLMGFPMFLTLKILT
uniref:NADH dehydrogenase subunit 2 n=1 Tax=Apphia sp. 1 SJ-2023a TaxID=3040699 RepID=UPI0025520976|nr:NADH dehydrogenase subunit 2 [Apphia sp. 1 SJ-2023a]WGC89430.1 NADH dehydrogenase subunit 2 [Apphia sp. 1 SJ-2023a]